MSNRDERRLRLHSSITTNTEINLHSSIIANTEINLGTTMDDHDTKNSPV